MASSSSYSSYSPPTGHMFSMERSNALGRSRRPTRDTSIGGQGGVNPLNFFGMAKNQVSDPVIAARNYGLSMMAMGTNMQVRGYTAAINAILATARFNSEIARQQTARSVDGMNRQAKRLFSSTRADIGASGFNASSKSFLMLANEGLDAVALQINQFRTDAYHQNQADMFEANTAAHALAIKRQDTIIQAVANAVGNGASIAKNQTNAPVVGYTQ